MTKYSHSKQIRCYGASITCIIMYILLLYRTANNDQDDKGNETCVLEEEKDVGWQYAQVCNKLG